MFRRRSYLVRNPRRKAKPKGLPPRTFRIVGPPVLLHALPDATLRTDRHGTAWVMPGCYALVLHDVCVWQVVITVWPHRAGDRTRWLESRCYRSLYQARIALFDVLRDLAGLTWATA